MTLPVALRVTLAPTVTVALALTLAPATGTLVLIGDQRQLAPTCISREAAELGLGRSLFDRLMQWTPLPPSVHHHLLTVQYRMHPLLSCFPSHRFYQGMLVNGVSAHCRAPPPSFPTRAVTRAVTRATTGATRPSPSPSPPPPSPPLTSPPLALSTPPSPPLPSPLAFVDTAEFGAREQAGRYGASKVNLTEARLIAKVLS